MKNIIAIVSLLVLCGCIPHLVSHKPVTLPNKSQGYLVTCNGGINTIADCMEEAAKICPKGYDIVQQNAETGAVGNVVSGAVVTVTKRNMIVRCR